MHVTPFGVLKIKCVFMQIKYEKDLLDPSRLTNKIDTHCLSSCIKRNADISLTAIH